MTTTLSKTDGAAGGRRAAAFLTIATCAEVSHTTMDEDNAKVDLRVSFCHAHLPRHLLTFHCQVKSGPSFFSPASNKKRITLQNIDEKTRSSLSRGTRPSLLVWVPPKPATRIYWHIFGMRNTEKTPIRIPRKNYISPALRYDLSKASTYLQARRDINRLDIANQPEAKVLGVARAAYKALGKAAYAHPLAGPVKLTRFAWRHVTRRGRPKAQRIRSLRAVPYLKHFLTQVPTRYLVANHKSESLAGHTTESRDVICWYNDALHLKSVGGGKDESYTILLRIREEITYPTNWWQYPLGVKDIRHEAKLVSWWCKPKK